jgi:hypothetical protein
MNRLDSFRTLGFSVFTIVLSAACAMAQSNSAVILGTVNDSTGAAIVGVKVTVLNQGTNISTTVSTKSEGQYTATNIEPGSYRVTATSEGFAEKSVRDITVFVNQTVRVDVSLEVGAVSTRTEVQATALVVQSETSSIGQVVDSRQVTKMPLDGRGNLNGLLALTPGVMSTGQNPLISGGVWFGSTNLTVDGVSDIDTGNERLGPVVPSLESVEARISFTAACLSSTATDSSPPRIFSLPASPSRRSIATSTGRH